MSSVTVAVVGGGPAGAVTALGLARAKVPVALLEQSDGSGNSIGENLAPSARPLLQRLGLETTVAATKPLDCHANRSSWGGDGSLQEHHFLNEPHGPGWHLDRPAFNAALLDAATQAGVDVRRQTRVRAAHRRGDGRWRLDITTAGRDEAIEATTIIDASGRRAQVARQLGAERLMFDRLTAAAATLVPTNGAMADSTTLVEAVEAGWWYSALLPNGRLMAIFFTDPDLLAATGTWRGETWCAQLRTTRHTWDRVASHGYRLAERPTVSAAYSAILSPCYGDGWLAAGDAAATYDPLSSFGIGSAVDGARRAAGAVVDSLNGDATAFARYAGTITESYARYLKMWRAYYAEERRWPEAPFWKRRQGDASLP